MNIHITPDKLPECIPIPVHPMIENALGVFGGHGETAEATVKRINKDARAWIEYREGETTGNMAMLAELYGFVIIAARENHDRVPDDGFIISVNIPDLRRHVNQKPGGRREDMRLVNRITQFRNSTGVVDHRRLSVLSNPTYDHDSRSFSFRSPYFESVVAVGIDIDNGKIRT